MKNPGIIILLSAAVLNTRAANDTPPAETTNVVVITTDYINRRVAEAETSLRESEVNYRLQQLRADITKALLTTALAERVVEIGEEDLSWVEATAKATDNKYRAGQAVVADTLQIA